MGKGAYRLRLTPQPLRGEQAARVACVWQPNGAKERLPADDRWPRWVGSRRAGRDPLAARAEALHCMHGMPVGICPARQGYPCPPIFGDATMTERANPWIERAISFFVGLILVAVGAGILDALIP